MLKLINIYSGCYMCYEIVILSSISSWIIIIYAKLLVGEIACAYEFVFSSANSCSCAIDLWFYGSRSISV